MKNEMVKNLLKDALVEPYTQIIQSFLAWFNISNFKTLQHDELKILTN